MKQLQECPFCGSSRLKHPVKVGSLTDWGYIAYDCGSCIWYNKGTVQSTQCHINQAKHWIELIISLREYVTHHPTCGFWADDEDCNCEVGTLIQQIDKVIHGI